MAPSLPHKLHIEITSDYQHLEEVVERSEAFVSKHIEDDDFVYRVVLSTSEAVTNAIKHGNKLDAEKQVRVELVVADASVEVTVEDEGTGYDREQLRDPLEEANLLNAGGRGVYLIESMADAVEFEERGRRIRMRFTRETPTA